MIIFLHVPAIDASRHLILVIITSHYLREKELIRNFYLFHVALLSNNWSEEWTIDHKKSTREKLRLEKVKN